LFEIGTSLAAARKGQSLTLADAERLTLLRGKYLEALEADDYRLLPGRTYARAFLRTYADALGLDADQFVEEFDARYSQPEHEEPVTLFRPHRRRRRPRLVVALIVVAALAGGLLWSMLTPTGKVSAPAPPPVSHAAPAHPRVAPAVPPSVPHKPVAQPALVIRAASGPCWLLVRRGGPTGAVLYEGTLEQGNAKRFAPRVWVRLGAPWNVTVRRGTHVVSSVPTSNPVNLTA
jgi:cytoskeleton protein RodZ